MLKYFFLYELKILLIFNLVFKKILNQLYSKYYSNYYKIGCFVLYSRIQLQKVLEICQIFIDAK